MAALVLLLIGVALVLAVPRGWLRDDRTAGHGALVLVVLWLGAVLAQPGATFDLSPSYAGFREVMSEGSWSRTYFAGAAIGAIGLWAGPGVIRAISCGIMFALLALTAVLFAVNSPLATGPGVYAVFAGLALRELLLPAR